jgi:hypothetical protein
MEEQQGMDVLLAVRWLRIAKGRTGVKKSKRTTKDQRTGNGTDGATKLIRSAEKYRLRLIQQIPDMCVTVSNHGHSPK